MSLGAECDAAVVVGLVDAKWQRIGPRAIACIVWHIQKRRPRCECFALLTTQRKLRLQALQPGPHPLE